jgi:glycyl-tRNA synthetase beta subunit
MNSSYSKIRHIRETNQRLEKRLIFEKIGEKLPSQSMKSEKGNWTKIIAEFLNYHYKINLQSSTTGSWTDKDYNDYLKRFMEENKIPVWLCKKGDGYCNDDSEGEVTTKDIKSLMDNIGSYIDSNVNSGLWEKFMSIQPNYDQDQKNNKEEKINTTNDKSYDYKLSDGKYYYSTKGQNNWVESTGKGLESIKANIKF